MMMRKFNSSPDILASLTNEDADAILAAMIASGKIASSGDENLAQAVDQTLEYINTQPGEGNGDKMKSYIQQNVSE